MSTSVAEVRAQSLVVTEDNLIVDLSDGRSITVPVAWYPRLVHGTPEERNNWRWIEPEKEFIGPIWTKTLASRTYSSATLRVKVRTRFGGGWKSGWRNSE
jgi:Protein of unknown function (DUF2442)